VSLFHDLAPSGDVAVGEARRGAPREGGRGRVAGWILLVAGIVGAVVLGLMPTPYVIERPGPVYDTLGEVRIDGEAQPLIDIPGETTYPTSGTLDLLTVNIVGTPSSPPTWVEVAAAWFDRTKAVVPIETIYPPGVTDEESREQSALEMTTSQQEAIAAALRDLDYEVPGVVTVAGVVAGSPADGVVREGDEIVSADGRPVQDVTELRAIIAGSGVGSPLPLALRRDGVEVDVEVEPVVSEEDGTTPVVGVYTGARYDLPFDVEIQLEDVGGPSAGMMFALGIIDKLTPGELTGGESIAGTGTITADGEVGPIGGIRQKLHGALDAGAAWFLAPAGNCDEVVGNVPDGLTVVAVSTLDEALVAVEAFASGDGVDALPTCS
jgi:Lon-like protease